MGRVLVIEDDPTLLETLEYNYYERGAGGLFVVTVYRLAQSLGGTHSG